jgi:hypothetical protein
MHIVLLAVSISRRSQPPRRCHGLHLTLAQISPLAYQGWLGRQSAPRYQPPLRR